MNNILTFSLFHACLTMSNTYFDKMMDMEERVYLNRNTEDFGNNLLIPHHQSTRTPEELYVGGFVYFCDLSLHSTNKQNISSSFCCFFKCRVSELLILSSLDGPVIITVPRKLIRGDPHQ